MKRSPSALRSGITQVALAFALAYLLIVQGLALAHAQARGATPDPLAGFVICAASGVDHPAGEGNEADRSCCGLLCKAGYKEIFPAPRAIAAASAPAAPAHPPVADTAPVLKDRHGLPASARGPPAISA